MAGLKTLLFGSGDSKHLGEKKPAGLAAGFWRRKLKISFQRLKFGRLNQRPQLHHQQ
jgi:hypothetical protein